MLKIRPKIRLKLAKMFFFRRSFFVGSNGLCRLFIRGNKCQNVKIQAVRHKNDHNSFVFDFFP